MAKVPSKAYGLTDPLADLPPAPVIAQRAPLAGDTGYEAGTLWVDVPNDDVYVMTQTAGGAATWAVSSTGTVMLDRLLPDGGTSPVVPSAAHAITMTGGTNITTVGGLNTVTFNLDAAIALATSVTSPLYLFPAATDGEIRSTAGQDAYITLGDAAGANYLIIQSSTPANLVTIDSLGTVLAPNYTAAAGTDMTLTAPAGQDMDLTMGDAAGANLITFTSSTPADVGSINSLGQCVFPNFEAGTNLARISQWTTNLSLIQAFADDDTASGISSRKAIYGDMQISAGDGNSVVEAVNGYIEPIAASNVLQVTGVMGICQQADGSVIASTASGVEGHLNLLETDIADAPAVYAFGVKGYLDSVDGAAVPAGICAGVGSVVEYNTPFNGKAYGVAVTRLDAGAGAGTAGQAAFGVVQGSVAIPDWLYGLDLAGATSGLTTADIRFQNSSTIVSAAAGVTFNAVGGDDFTFVLGDAVGANSFIWMDSGATNEVASVNSLGDLTARNVNYTNTNITFNSAPVMATKANTGGVPTGATGDENLMVLQQGEIMEQHILGAGQTIIAPVMDANGLLVSLDLTNNEGAEYSWGFLATNKHAFTIGTSNDFFFEVEFTIADVTGADPVYIGFRKQEAYQAAFTNYTDFYLIGVEESQTTAVITIADQLNTGGVTYTNTTDAWTDGQTHTLRVNVTTAGVVTATIDGAAPSTPRAFTFDNTDVIMPCIYFLHGATNPGAINLVSMACGYQIG